ncbi:STAS domain-containing protein [Roseateles sp. DB2]|uniref:STAS domain-containing protein n=1 Tax=Roseateles sp. DB2 TaxID=3453717 RepID=UPI003EEB4756
MSATARCLHPQGELTIFRAAELKSEWLQALHDADGTLELDLAGVTELDTAGLQLLMMLKREATAQGRPLRLHGHSPAVLEVFELLNVAAFFGDPLIMPLQDGAR